MLGNDVFITNTKIHKHKALQIIKTTYSHTRTNAYLKRKYNKWEILRQTYIPFSKDTYIQTQTQTQTYTEHTLKDTHARTHTQRHTHTYTHTHTDTHKQTNTKRIKNTHKRKHINRNT